MGAVPARAQLLQSLQDARLSLTQCELVCAKLLRVARLPRPDRMAHLVPPTGRWTASRKVQVLCAINSGIVDRAAAAAALGDTGELARWEGLFADHGPDSLATKRIQVYRANLADQATTSWHPVHGYPCSQGAVV